MRQALLLLCCWLPASACRLEPASPVRIAGRLELGQPITLSLQGPWATEAGEPNPFLDYRFTATFTQQESGREVVVPGYFAADGAAADSGAGAGSVWRVHFVPEQAGSWQYTTSLRQAPHLALSAVAAEGNPVTGDGISGTFIVRDAVGADRPRGRLRHEGGRYLRHSLDGSPFLKSGADSPENFLAYIDFDAEDKVERPPGAPREGEAATAPRHRYRAHEADWKTGDPTWRNGRGKGIIGALNYLASKGVNSLYFLTLNRFGDGDDVWPYTGPDERYRFDCSKLDQWDRVFRHMDRLGIMLHVVLSETENESLFEAEEGGNFADSRKLYYRELVARFAYHQAVTWNLGEENGWNDPGWDRGAPQRRANTDEQRRAFAAYLSALDPFGNPIVVHTLPGRYDEIYTPLLGDSPIDGPSLQIADVRSVHAETIRWIDRSAAAGRPWFVSLDEIGPADTGVKPDADDPRHDDIRRFALWGNLMAGGAGCEWYFGYRYPDNDLGLEDFRSRERLWEQSRIAVDFFQRYLPFPDMQHADERLTNPAAYCLAAGDGSILAIYLPAGESTRIALPLRSRYQVAWFNPRRGGDLQSGSQTEIAGGPAAAPGAPPAEPTEDWLILLHRVWDTSAQD